MTVNNNTTLIVNNYCISKYFKIPFHKIQDINMFINDTTKYEVVWIDIVKDGRQMIKVVVTHSFKVTR